MTTTATIVPTDSVMWHVGFADGTTLAVIRPDRADAAPVNVWHPDGSFRQDHSWRHVAVASAAPLGVRAWGPSPCPCRDVRPEPVRG